MKLTNSLAMLAASLLFVSSASAVEEADANQTKPEEETEEKQGPVTATDRIVKRFMALDTDESEGVSFEEYMAMVEERAKDRFKAMDADEDGAVTDEEYRAFWTARKAKYYRLKR